MLLPRSIFTMLIITALSTILPLLIPATSQADINRITANAKISAVTVYQDRAQVTRTAVVQLKQGSNLIAIDALPLLLQDDSVRVTASGTAQATINSVEVSRSFLAESADPRIRELDSQIRLLEQNLGGISSQKAGLEAQQGFIDSIKLGWGNRISQQLTTGKPVAGELNDAISFVGSNTTRVADQKLVLDQKATALQAEIDALKQQKQEAGNSRRKESKTVEIAVNATKAGSLTFELTSLVSQATWEPGYDVRLAEDGRTATLTYRAQIRQQTGEDWQNTPLTISTARPASGGTPPVMYPWQIAFSRPMPVAAPRETVRLNKLAAAPMVAAQASPDLQYAAGFQTAQVQTEGTSVAFKIPGVASIPSDNRQHSTVVAMESLPVQPEYTVVPKLSSRAFLMAELENKADWPLMPGTIRIFNGNTFTGSSHLKLVASGEKFLLPFGGDDQILVKHELFKQHQEAGLFGNNKMTYSVNIAVTNLHKEAVVINLKDQLPLAGDSEIKISLDKASLQPDEQQTDGTLIWKLRLAAGAKQEISYNLVVEYPKGRAIMGL